MSAADLLRLLGAAIFVLVFAVVLVRAVRWPSRSTVDVALLFGSPALVIVEAGAAQVLGWRLPQELAIASVILLLALPLLTLRAIEGLTLVARRVVPLATLGWLLSSAFVVLLPTPLPAIAIAFVLVYFIALEGYGGLVVLRATRAARGVVRRRLQLIGSGTVLLALVFVVAALAIAVPAVSGMTTVLAVLAGLAYLIGFAPPPILRRAWEAPAVYQFIAATNRLASDPDIEGVRFKLAKEVAAVVGAAESGIGIWDEARAVLVFYTARDEKVDRTLDESMAARAFTEQRPLLEDEATSRRRIPQAYRSRARHLVLAAPMTVGAHRIGVVSTIASRESTFVEDDLTLLQLIAEHTAVVLEHRRLYRDLAAVNTDLEHRVGDMRVLNDELAAFAYSVSHDLRAPLRSIDGFSQILLEDHGEQLAPEAREHLGRVRAAAGRMGLLIDDLLALSRVSRDEIQREPVDLARMAGAIVADLRARDPDRSVEVALPADLTAIGDPRLLRVALTNLIENAWKFTRKRVPAHITLRGEPRDGEVVVSVCDDGAGFDMRYAPKLFGAFQRLHTQDEFEGTGIGLATVQRIVHRHRGRIWAESELGNGATFSFTLPLR